MSTIVMQGNHLAKEIRSKVKTKVNNISVVHGRNPRLDVIIVDERPDSVHYVKLKTLVCDEVGIRHKCHSLPQETSQEELVVLIDQLNEDADVNGILIQFPLPSHIDRNFILDRLSPSKDVDGLTFRNQGLVMAHGIGAPIIPCTPFACLSLLKHYNISLSGLNTVVVGRSVLVGQPLSLLLQSLNATVTVAHSHTRNVHDIVKQADLVVAALGKAKFIQRSWLKDRVVVVDVGTNYTQIDGAKYKLEGDVDLSSEVDLSSDKTHSLSDSSNSHKDLGETGSSLGSVAAYTPVPGGVGPVTVAMLMVNTVRLFALQHSTLEHSNTFNYTPPNYSLSTSLWAANEEDFWFGPASHY